MRIMALMLISSAVACAGSSAPGDSTGGATPAVVTATEDLRIDAETADLSFVGTMIVAESGDIFLTQGAESLIRVFSASGEARPNIGRNGGGPGEFSGRAVRIGWLGDSIWASDAGWRRVSIFGPDYKFVRAFSFPETVSSSTDSAGPEMDTFVQAVLPDGGLRIAARLFPGLEPPAWVAGIDSTRAFIVRTDLAGRFEKLLAPDPGHPCAVSFPIGTSGSGGFPVPFCTQPLHTGLDGYQEFATVLVDQADPQHASYRVTLVAASGDTAFSRDYPFTPMPVSQGALDSSVARQKQHDAELSPEYLAARPAIVPATTWAPIRRVVIGRDATIWLEEGGPLPERRWRILGAEGEVLGVVTLPLSVTIKAADRNNVWGLHTDDDGLQSIVRYKLATSMAP